MNHYDRIELRELGNSEVELVGEIPLEEVMRYRAGALRELGKETSIPGFRKGHVPEKVLLERLGEPAVLFEAAERALGELYPRLIEEKKLAVIGRPEVTLTKLAPGNPVGFKIKTALIPEVKLPDYRAIARNIMRAETETAVTEAELETAIGDILKRFAGSPEGSPETAGKPAELTETFVQGLGDFKDVADFKTKMKAGMEREKADRGREKRRVEVSDRLVEETSIAIPGILIESELEKMLGQFKDDLTRMNMTFEDYLKKIKKTEADLRSDWKANAEKRARLQLILNEIAVKENLTPDEKAVETEVSHIREHYKNADPERARIYVSSMLRNELAYKLLEEQGEPEKEKDPTSRTTEAGSSEDTQARS